MAVSTPVNAEDRPSNWLSFSALVTAITSIPVVHRQPFTVHRRPFTVHRRPFTVHRRPFTVQPFATNGQPSTVTVNVNESVLDRFHTGRIDAHPRAHRGRHGDALQVAAFRGGRLGLHDAV